MMRNISKVFRHLYLAVRAKGIEEDALAETCANCEQAFSVATQAALHRAPSSSILPRALLDYKCPEDFRIFLIMRVRADLSRLRIRKIRSGAIDRAAHSAQRDRLLVIPLEIFHGERNVCPRLQEVLQNTWL